MINIEGIKSIPAICPICGGIVEHAFYDNGKLISDGFIICSDGKFAYHLEKGRDCWGKHTGYPNDALL